MVSFQCEGCGDTLTKKKLDGHRNQCRGAPFTCIDCMTTFQGTSYRAHTSCISEDQKYQGALYREKPSKAAKRKSVSIVEPDNSKALVPRAAYVEDAPDVETPPHVPTPPPAVPDSNRDSVFDYMVDDSTAGTPQISFAKDKGEMSMKSSAPSIFTNSRPSSQNGHRDEEGLHNQEYEEQGYTWGVEPVKPRGALDMNGSALSLEFMTPAAKQTKSRLEKTRPRAHSRTESSEKKRKRATDDQHHDSDRDMLVVDTSRPDTPGIVHSGLTGGLSRMITEDEYPFHREPDTVDRRLVVEKDRHSRRTHKPEDPTSPLKRTRHTKDDPNGLGISIKGRAVKALSMVGGALLPGSQFEAQQANTRVRRRASSSDHGQNLSRVREGEKRERKKHKVHRHNGTASANIRHEHRSRRRGNSDDSSQNEGTSRKLKAIEYRKHDDSASDSDDGGKRRGVDKAMVVFGEEQRMRHSCQNFLANAPGLESDKGYSIHKMLKRWHKQNDVRSTSSKADEESELWRALRIKRNERGEYVLVF